MTAHIPHLHAESMMLYAEDAAKTAKPWELWEFISFGMEDWQTLDSNPNWGFATDYRRKKRADPRDVDALDAERWRFIKRKLCLTGNGDGTCAMQALNLPARIIGWPDVGELAIAQFLDAAIDAAITESKENK